MLLTSPDGKISAAFCSIVLILGSAQYLSVLHSIRLLNSLVATPIGAALMRKTLPLPFIVVMCVSMTRYIVTWYLPESTPAMQQKLSNATTPADRYRSDSNSENVQPLLNGSEADHVRASCSSWATMQQFISSSGIVFCFCCFLVKRIAFTSENLMFQYVSEILRERLNQTSWVRIPLGLSATIVTSVVLPTLLQYLKSRRANSTVVDVWAIRTSLAILVAGFTMFWSFHQPHMMVIGKTSPYGIAR